jgi:hypothetical protein
MKSDQNSGTTSDEEAKPSRAELLAEVDRIRSMTPTRKTGASYPTAEELVQASRDSR